MILARRGSGSLVRFVLTVKLSPVTDGRFSMFLFTIVVFHLILPATREEMVMRQRFTLSPLRNMPPVTARASARRKHSS